MSVNKCLTYDEFEESIIKINDHLDILNKIGDDTNLTENLKEKLFNINKLVSDWQYEFYNNKELWNASKRLNEYFSCSFKR